ncbi:MAG: hypothetical protein Q4F31_10645 [Eubacteriales bacterium]|nr:hypothetical protein [Eubacteriales bacterium]
MTQNVLLEEGGSVSVHTRIKDMCKEARNRLGLTNQEISNLISERFGIEDFSVNTINNFFSERSKATTIYTTGYICAVLGISIDAVFGIETKISSEEEAEFIRQLKDVKVELRVREQQIRHLEDLISEKNVRLDQAHSALEHYRRESESNTHKVQPWVFIATLVLLVLSVLFIIVYLLFFDVGNPDYGLFRNVRFSGSDLRNTFHILSRFIH